MNKKFLQFTIGAADALVKKLIPANTEWFIEYTSTTVLTLTAVRALLMECLFLFIFVQKQSDDQ